MRYKCTCSYKGTAYVGFQSQKNGIAIQDVIEANLAVFTSFRGRITMASRTDSGVHALGQVFHFDLDEDIDTLTLKGKLNGLLPKDIHIIKVEKVADGTSARDTKGKHYRYLINYKEYDPLLEGLAYWCHYDLDMAKIREVMALFIGRHDFSSFNTTPLSVKPDQVRTITEFTVTEKGNMLIFDVKGDGFLRHMVRILVGTLIDVGRGKMSVETVVDMLERPRKDSYRHNIDPCGLYLVEIMY